MMIITPPTRRDYSDFYHTYVGKVTGEDLLKELKHQEVELIALIARLTPEELSYRYTADKWNIKEILIHMIDSERVFSYRALRFGRGDNTPLAGFDQNVLAKTVVGTSRTAQSISAEFELVRRSSIMLFENFTEKQLEFTGEASGSMVSVRALGYIILGHALHHQLIIEEKYINRI